MKIGELAKASSTPAETIRFYEREGLLHEGGRTEGNFRIYDQSHVERLIFVRHCRSLDMALDEIRQLLRFKESSLQNCAGVNELLDDHIGHVAKRIGELLALEQQLKLLRQRCGQATEVQACGIIESLSEEPPAPQPSPRGRRHVQGTH
ncbi:Cd(II)/Pb(II)-responsive transcriptional regulator [Variovorax sp. JS1663]|uniref:Cd(II)/Pb(II)-responsive transcriptional regulator n=1 Tax=Variovorax sp. JS1663 TaxID=1851577 RepID=UPI000B343B79|nr:Cd(II)/Pb(II)-responsive transcriptional regulator [Variovorax sp. JS1663]OUM00118.1 Cd(II)/Pb(II)-responsive transcriptional regulator [Variovorax sp. JS1663]